RACNRSLRLLTTRRLSLRDCAPGIRKSMCSTPMVTWRTSDQFFGDRLHAEAFDDIANGDVIVAIQFNTAFVSCGNGADIVLAAAQGADHAFMDDDAIANDAGERATGRF